MKTFWTVFGFVAAALLIIAGVYMVDIDQTQEARLPDVEVTAEGGQMPKFDAEVGSVEVTEETVEVTVPEVEVTTDTAEVTVPGLEINPPADDEG